MNTANETPDDLQALAGEYVLGTLDATQRRAVEARLAHDTALRAAVLAWEARLAPLNTIPEEQALPSDLWSRILRSIEPAVRTASRWHRWWNDLRLWRGLTAGGFVTAALLCGLLVMRPAGEAPSYMVVLVPPQGQQPGYVIQAKMDKRITLTPLASDNVPAQKSLQFWTKGDSWNAPVSLGLVQPGQKASFALDHLPPLQSNQLFEITLEPENGSPIGRPTGPILYIGRAVKVTS
ncbi:MAG: anti-sigma factor [Oxalicibacterium faecigallinarum]|uniref:Regulator of SigK n=1 Tax=Oxalicibacterium faecigallinarum TaxID=573741 RepID=A0A8J3F0W6_9BURK|nr:anti-sigma factor [Oxalicibacterium faecigallinarum]MDQ7970416.1 anti-sigma factor [Oxalicibacterium faecigallinarum]GGI18335.1 DNA-directed RNA polymerase sigma-70 factor [Oxalicibacterium faecigallinarum]